MKTVDCGEIVRYDGLLYKVIGYSTMKTVVLEPLEDNKTIKCPHCGEEIGIKERQNVVEDSRLFQDNVEAVETLKEV